MLSNEIVEVWINSEMTSEKAKAYILKKYPECNFAFIPDLTSTTKL